MEYSDTALRSETQLENRACVCQSGSQKARQQRKAMNSLIRAAALSWEGEDIGEDPCIDDIMDDVDAPAVGPVGRDESEPPKSRRILVQCEDFGQGLPLPYFHKTRPGIDYSTSSLVLNNFVVADVTLGKSQVVLFALGWYSVCLRDLCA